MSEQIYPWKDSQIFSPSSQTHSGLGYHQKVMSGLFLKYILISLDFFSLLFISSRHYQAEHKSCTISITQGIIRIPQSCLITCHPIDVLVASHCYHTPRVRSWDMAGLDFICEKLSETLVVSSSFCFLLLKDKKNGWAFLQPLFNLSSSERKMSKGTLQLFYVAVYNLIRCILSGSLWTSLELDFL